MKTSGLLKNTQLPDRILIFLLVLIPLVCGAVSVRLGRDVSWDLKNYHYYNAYAFLEGRMDVDIAPAQVQTYINPLADLPFYWMARNLPARLVGFILGVVHGLNLSFLLLIFWKVSGLTDKWSKLLWGTSLVIVSGIAPMFLSELGNTMQDNLTSAFVLGALLLLVLAHERLAREENRVGNVFIVLAGLVIGMGVGLKPSNVIFAVGSAVMVVLFRAAPARRLARLVVYGLSGIAGGLVTAGFWWLEMFRRFGNPLFPFYTHILRSPMITEPPVNWSFYVPRGIWEYIFWPVIVTLDATRSNQFAFTDIRLALLFGMFLVWGAAAVSRRFRLLPPVPARPDLLIHPLLGNLLLGFALVSYVLWLRESATYRFIIPLELLAPLLVLLLIERVIPSRRLVLIAALCASAATLAVFTPFDWDRAKWDERYFSVDTSPFDPGQSSIVVMLGTSPTSYVIPEFPPSYRFVRMEGNLYMHTDSSGNVQIRDTGHPYFKTIRSLQGSEAGPFYILYNEKDTTLDRDESLRALGILPEGLNCFRLRTNVPDWLTVCQVIR